MPVRILVVKLKMNGSSDCMLLLFHHEYHGTRAWLYDDTGEKREMSHAHPLVNPEPFKLLLNGGKVVSKSEIFTLAPESR